MKKLPFSTQLPILHSLGTQLFDPIWAEKMHTSSACELLHVIRGRVEVVLRRERVAAKPGDTLVLPAHTAHRDDFDTSAGLEVFMVQFSWSGDKDFFAQVGSADLPRLPEAQKEAVARQVLRLRRDFASGTVGNELLARVYVQDILLQLLASVLRNQQTEPREAEGPGEFGRQRRRWLFEQAKAYLEANYQQPVALDDIAKALHVSPYHLSHVFSAESDFSLFEFLTRLRMERARQLLEAGQSTVAEVAYSVGFDSSNYFSKVFHRHFGIRPRELHSRGAELQHPCRSV